MAEFISTIVGAIEPATALLAGIANYRKKKRTEARLASSFENEVRGFVDVFNQVSEYGEKVAPILETTQDELSVHQMNERALDHE